MDLQNMFGKLQDLQANMQKMRDGLDDIKVEADAGGGMVRVEANANKRILKVTIDPQALTDREMLEDLIAAAVNKALEKAEEESRGELGKLTQGMVPPNIPGLDMSKFGL